MSKEIIFLIFSELLDARYDSYTEEKAANPQQESRLLTHLMENYDREVRPVYNASKAVVVKVGITLTQIFDMVSINYFVSNIIVSANFITIILNNKLDLHSIMVQRWNSIGLHISDLLENNSTESP